jgi:hypothetical protein
MRRNLNIIPEVGDIRNFVYSSVEFNVNVRNITEVSVTEQQGNIF